MKTLKLLSVLLLLPAVFYAQHSLTGLWTGALSNDSTTIRRDQAFEIALTEYRGKVYGYSRSSFLVHDTLFYILKRVKGKIEDGICEIKDDEIISSNFPGRKDKGVGVTTTFKMNKEDTTWHLDGNWKTNKTKNFYSVSGKVALKEEKNLDNSKIFPHLEELSLDKDVAFYQEKKNPAPISFAKPIVPEASRKKEKENVKDAVVTETKIKEKDVVKEATAKQTVKKEEAVPAIQKPVIKSEEKPLAKAEPPKSKPAELKTIGSPEAKTETVAVVNPPKTQEPVAIKAIASEIKAGPAALVAERKILPPQIVTFKSDSLELALYDNGEVDGDTVSVLMNGQIIIAKQGLKTSASRKTITIAAGTDEVTLLLYAENLGKYPPNTGLLVVHDGEDVYQVRFTADLQQNAAVIFKRKK